MIEGHRREGHTVRDGTTSDLKDHWDPFYKLSTALVKSGSVCQMLGHAWCKQHGQVTAMKGAVFVMGGLGGAKG